MAKKTLYEQPTSTSDYAYSDYESFSRKEFVDAYPLGTSSVISIIGSTIAGLLPNVGWIPSITNALSGLSNTSKQTMVNEVYTAFTRFTEYNYVFISAKFSGHRQGSQGWFWLPANGYRVYYTS